MGSRDPGLYVWLCGEVLAHFLALQFMLSKNPKGLEGSINSPTPITLSVPHSRLTVLAARLIFRRSKISTKKKQNNNERTNYENSKTKTKNPQGVPKECKTCN